MAVCSVLRKEWRYPVSRWLGYLATRKAAVCPLCQRRPIGTALKRQLRMVELFFANASFETEGEPDGPGTSVVYLQKFTSIRLLSPKVGIESQTGICNIRGQTAK